jgi:hypothetical protein
MAALKKIETVNDLKSTYAVVVEGLTFSCGKRFPVVFEGQLSQQERIVVFKTSSPAKPNCCII